MEAKKEEPVVEEKTQEPEDNSLNLIEKAGAAAERLEKANLKQEELLNRQEDLMARSVLRGNAEAGIQKEKAKEETPQDYADKVRRGEVDPLK